MIGNIYFLTLYPQSVIRGGAQSDLTAKMADKICPQKLKFNKIEKYIMENPEWRPKF